MDWRDQRVRRRRYCAVGLGNIAVRAFKPFPETSDRHRPAILTGYRKGLSRTSRCAALIVNRGRDDRSALAERASKRGMIDNGFRARVDRAGRRNGVFCPVRQQTPDQLVQLPLTGSWVPSNNPAWPTLGLVLEVNVVSGVQPEIELRGKVEDCPSRRVMRSG